MKSLNAKRMTQANYDNEFPDDIRWAGEPQPHLAAKVGIAAKELAAQRQSEFMAILNSFTSHMADEVIKQRMDLIKTAGIDQIYVGFCG